MRVKTGLTVKGIVGLVFAPMGLLFLAIGLIFTLSDSVTWQGNGDPQIFRAVFCGMGGLFLILGLLLLWSEYHRRQLLQRACDSGNCVNAEITGVVMQTNVNTMKGHPCVVECSWRDSSDVVHIYRSRYLYTDVTKLLKSTTVPVYIDPYNENVGYVDIDAVLPEIRIHS